VTTPALDRNVLESLRQLTRPGEPDVLREVLVTFLADAPGRVAAITNAIQCQDAHALLRAAHTFKGAAASIGAAGVQSRCLELESAARKGDVDQGAAALLSALCEEFERVRSEIARLL
jgi:HPt (histidine-containing phosphotransfer) domain-containing protein